MNYLTLVVLCMLAGCASKPEIIYTPKEVKVPVPVPCQMPRIAAPPDLLAALPNNTNLTTGMKTCLAQDDYNKGYEAQLQAAISACSR
jgi:hypothetical protein